jgi:hypothetical protein
MYFQIIKPKTANEFLNRLSDVEKIQIRMASRDRLEHMRVNDFASDGPMTEETLLVVQQTLLNRFKAESNVPGGF